MSDRATAHRLRMLGHRLLIAMVAALVLPCNSSQAVESLNKLWEMLPAPAGTRPAPVATQPQHVIPVARPINPEEVQLQESEGSISLTVRDASLRQVVSLIAETQRLNIVFASPTDVPVTASLDQVPWRQALDSLLLASGHMWTEADEVIFVTSIDTADLVAPRAGGRRVQVFELDYAMATDVDQTVQGLLSPAGKSWVMESSSEDNRRTREVVAVVDYPGHLEQIAEYISQADQPPRQVMIEANILQVELDEDCRSGVNFEQITSFSGNQIRLIQRGLANPIAPSASFIEVDGVGLNSLVEILQTTVDAKTLASPKVMAVSGQEARIQIGGRLGFRVTTTTQTSTLESIDFIDVGVVLSVTPRITRDGRVLMRIKPEVSTGQVDPNTGLPSEETTEVETDILLENGRGMVIGGLIQEQDSNTQSKIPWLGDLPYAGVLFQKRQLVKKRTEIIVTLIPHVLPYTPIQAAQNDHQFMRTQERLTCGPLDRVHRPYEAKLADTFDNPNRPWVARRYARPMHLQAVGPPVDRGELVPLPPVEEPSQPFEVPQAAPVFAPPNGTSNFHFPARR